MKRLAWFEILLIVVVMSISLYAAFADGQNFSWRWFTRDDAYYYFKVAQNISEGHGSTFDGINRTNGYHPLWMAICIPIFALARFDLILPLRILFLVLSGLSVATAILLYRLIGRVFIPAIGALAAVYWVFSLDVLIRVYKQGLETGIAAFLIVLLSFLLLRFENSWRSKSVTRNDLIVLGFIGALVIFSRLDLIFLVAFVGIWVVFRGSPIRSLLPLDIVSVAFAALLAFVIQAGFPAYYELEKVAVTMLAAGLLVKIPLAYLLGLYMPDTLSQARRWIPRLALFVVLSTLLVGLIMTVTASVLSFVSFPKIVLVYDASTTFILFLLVRLFVSGLKTDHAPSAEEESPLMYFSRNWKQWLIDGSWYYGIAFGTLGIYMVWSKFAFGTTSPVSGQIKRWWGSLSGAVYGGSVKNLLGFFGISYTGEANAWHPVSNLIGGWAEKIHRILKIEDTWRYLIFLAIFALLFYCLLLINRHKAKTSIARLSIIPLLAGAMFQVFYYHMLGYSAYKEWYWVIQPILIVLVVSLMIGMVYTGLRKVRWIGYGIWTLAIAYGLYLGITFGSYVQGNMTHGEWAANAPYFDISAFLEENTQPGSVIGMTGGGNAAYFIKDRTVVNMDGLINSYEYFQLLKQKQAGQYLADMGMNYVLANTGILDSLPYRGQYRQYLEPTGLRYGGKDLSRYHASQP